MLQSRRIANPNLGFQRQLLEFSREGALDEKARLYSKFGVWAREADDVAECRRLLALHDEHVQSLAAQGSLPYEINYPLAYHYADSPNPFIGMVSGTLYSIRSYRRTRTLFSLLLLVLLLSPR